MQFNPQATTNAAGTFNVTSSGLIQGTAYDSPDTRFQLSGGVLAPGEQSMFGGVGVYALIPGTIGTPNRVLGVGIGRATLLTGAKALCGFSVFDQNHAAIQTPQSPVPQADVGMEVNYYRFGSNARIAVAMDPALVNLQGQLITTQVSWDFGAQRLIAYDPAHTALAISNATWAGGVATFTTAAHTIPVGTGISISGMNPAGYNGNFLVASAPNNTTLTVAMPVNPGAFVSGGQVDAGGGILPVRVLETDASNAMTVVYDPITGNASWNRNGAAAVILI